MGRRKSKKKREKKICTEIRKKHERRQFERIWQQTHNSECIMWMQKAQSKTKNYFDGTNMSQTLKRKPIHLHTAEQTMVRFHVPCVWIYCEWPNAIHMFWYRLSPVLYIVWHSYMLRTLTSFSLSLAVCINIHIDWKNQRRLTHTACMCANVYNNMAALVHSIRTHTQLHA